jgi:ribosomal protein S19E (S16A)
MPDALAEYAKVVPLNALSAYGFGPLARKGSAPLNALASLRRSSDGVWAAIDTAGVTGRRLLVVLGALGGSSSRQQLEFQTAQAAPGVLDATLARLERAGLVTAGPDGRVEVTTLARGHLPPTTISLAESELTSDALALICRALGLKAPTKKHERLAAITRTFSDKAACGRIRSELTPGALALLDRVVAAAGPGVAPAESIGLTGYVLHAGQAPRFAMRLVAREPEVEALSELTSRGIVGVSPWDPHVWVWREAWPLVDQPFLSDWAARPEPRVVAAPPQSSRVPGVVAALDGAIKAWEVNPPKVLKTGDARIPKADVRATAKALGAAEQAVETAATLAISISLLLPNVVGRSGRGRNATEDKVWLPDPSMLEVWRSLAPMARWARLVAEWCAPRLPCGDQLLVNRHLVLWELAQLAPGEAYADVDEFVAWFHDRHASLGHPEAARDCVTDLEALGMVTVEPLALTAPGRAVLDDPASVTALVASEATAVVVQADLTVIAPPDLRHDLAAHLDEIADLESAAGALTYRLDATRITRAVQDGQSAAGIVELLAGISTTPLPDTVVRLVHDAAARAGSVRVIAAPTVVVVSDPADLATACAMKSLKLTRVSDTVAVTEVALAKVQAALQRKGLAPEALVGGGGRQARSSLDEAARAAQQAAELRSLAQRRSNPYFERHAKQLDQQAQALADVHARLQVSGPLTVTPGLLGRLELEDHR